jgi:hypothetical protein
MGGQDSNLGLTDYELPNRGDLACIYPGFGGARCV